MTLVSFIDAIAVFQRCNEFHRHEYKLLLGEHNIEVYIRTEASTTSKYNIQTEML